MNKLNLNRLPTKWLVGLFVVVVLYSLLQPQLNKRLGWNLPSIADLQSDSPRVPPNRESEEGRNPQGDLTHSGPLQSEPTKNAPTTNRTGSPAPADPSERSGSASPHSTTPPSAVPSKPRSERDYLSSLGGETYRSPAGLIYRRGSEEGHRLRHIERHLKDDPTRPGSHGVFEGDMVTYLQTIDEAYLRAKKGDKGTATSEDEGRTIYDVTFPKTIGYLGGQQGKRKSYPKLKRLKIVLDGDSVITAYPF